MFERVFIQRSRLGRVILTLRDNEIEVTQEFRGKLQSVPFPLRSISTDYSVKTVHLTVGVAIALAVAAVCAGTAIVIFRHTEIPPIFGYYPCYGAIIFMLIARRLTPRFVFLEFSNHWGTPLFSIARERGQSEECDAFLRDLLGRIERARGEQAIRTFQLPQ